MDAKERFTESPLPHLRNAHQEAHRWLTEGQADMARNIDTAYSGYERQYARATGRSGTVIERAETLEFLVHYLHFLLHAENVRQGKAGLLSTTKEDPVFDQLSKQVFTLKTDIKRMLGYQTTHPDDFFIAQFENSKQDALTKAELLNGLVSKSIDVAESYSAKDDVINLQRGALIAHVRDGLLKLQTGLDIVHADIQSTPQSTLPPTPQIETPTLVQSIKDVSFEQLKEKLQASKPNLYQWLCETGWKTPAVGGLEKSLPLLPSQLREERLELRRLLQETQSLSELAMGILSQPSLVAAKSREAFGRRDHLSLVVEQGELVTNANTIDGHEEAHRYYDDLVEFAGDAQETKFAIVHNLISKVIGNSHNLVHLTTERYPKNGADRAKQVDYDIHLIARNAMESIGKLGEYIQNARWAPALKLMPYSLEAAVFCKDEVYPRIWKNAQRIQELVNQVGQAYTQEAAGAQAVTEKGQLVDFRERLAARRSQADDPNNRIPD